MLSDETQPVTYFLFDHSYAGGSWNMAVIEQAAVLKKRAETAEAKLKNAEAECDRLRLHIQTHAGDVLSLSQELFGCEESKREEEGRTQDLEAECDRLKRENDALRGVKDRLLPASDALFALRRHMYECDDCAGEDPCGVADGLWQAAIRACDEIYGKPDDWE